MDNVFNNSCIGLLRHFNLAKQGDIDIKIQNGKRGTASLEYGVVALLLYALLLYVYLTLSIIDGNSGKHGVRNSQTRPTNHRKYCEKPSRTLLVYHKMNSIHTKLTQI